jgi:hypothetical protein
VRHPGRHLEGETCAAGFCTTIELNSELADARRQVSRMLVTLCQHEPHDVGVIVDLPFDICGLERDMADTSHLDHNVVSLGKSPMR